MRDACVARDEVRAGRQGQSGDGMTEDVQTKPDPQPEAASAAGSSSTMTPEELEAVGNELIAALKTVYDPEIPVDIYELGLIYKVDVADNKDVTIDMTLTAPGCPVAGEMPIWVENAVGSVEGVQIVKVNMVFDPPWTMDRMTEDAKFALNLF
jgi:FeS assembly SUF system protein